MTTGFRTFDATLQKTKEWMYEVNKELGWGGEPQAYHCLRAVLHTLRDRIPVEEAVQLGDQLPLLLKGIYYEGWKPRSVPLKLHQEDFYALVAQRLAEGSKEIDPEEATAAVLRVLSRHVSAGEIDDVKATLPKDIVALWPRGADAGFDVAA